MMSMIMRIFRKSILHQDCFPYWGTAFFFVRELVPGLWFIFTWQRLPIPSSLLKYTVSLITGIWCVSRSVRNRLVKPSRLFLSIVSTYGGRRIYFEEGILTQTRNDAQKLCRYVSFLATQSRHPLYWKI